VGLSYSWSCCVGGQRFESLPLIQATGKGFLPQICSKQFNIGNIGKRSSIKKCSLPSNNHHHLESPLG